MNILTILQSPALLDEGQRRSRLVLLTLPIVLIPVLLPLLLVTVASLVLQLTHGQPLRNDGPPGPRLTGVLVALAVVAVVCSGLIMLVRLGRPTLSAMVLIGVWALVAAMVVLPNGATTISTAVLIMPICAAGILFDRAGTLLLALFGALLVMLAAWMEFSGLTPPDPVPKTLINIEPFIAAGFWITMFGTVAGLTGLLAGDLQRALAQSHTQAAELRQLSAQLEARVADQTAELAQRAARAEALHEVSRALANTLDLDQVLALISEQAARLLRFDSAVVLLEEHGHFTPVGAYRALDPHNQHMPTYEPMLREIAALRRPTVLRVPPTHSIASSDIATLILPMHYAGQLTGMLLLFAQARDAERGADDLALAEGLADQAAVAIANARLVAQLHEKATLEERARLARDIHDTLAQGLTGVVVQLSAARDAARSAPAALDEHLDLAERMARESLAEARRSVWNLRAPALERGDLADALQVLVARPLRPETSVSFERRGTPWPLPPSVESALLRVAQEALVNVSKHAHASAASVLLEYSEEAVALHICDNGVGFDQAALARHTSAGSLFGGFGLLGMRERLHALGGRLEIACADGAQVRAIVPRTRG